jgi:copper chaperone
MTSMTYQVTGMTCEHCVRAVTDEIASLAGVSGVTVALVPGGESAVTVTSDGPLATEVVAATLDEAGAYNLSGLADTAGSVTAPAP